MKKTAYFALPLMAAGLATSALTGCLNSTIAMREETAERIAGPAFMVERDIPAQPFLLTAYERVHENGGTANIYIEGDGLAWVSKSRISLDPTPKNPVSLHLASRDKAENVIYLARPCQYSKLLDAPETPCNSAYWTNKRFAPEVLSAYDAALDNIKARYGISGFNLVGFSGGGAVAAILAGQRNDVLSLRTVAGNLDHRAHSAYHHVTYLDDSLNPPEYAAKLRTVPQYHFLGGRDAIVPPAVLHSYLQALGPSRCVQYELIQDAGHDEGWVNKWPELLAKKPVCTVN